MNSKKRLNQFLKERGLLKAYRREKKIKWRKRDNLHIDGEKIPVTIYKKGDKTIIAHAYNLKEISSSRKYNIKNIKKAIKEDKLTPKFLTVRRYKNFDLEVTKTIRRKKVGRALVNVTFKKGKKSFTVEADSGFTVPLSSAAERKRAEEKAFERAKAQLPFYDYSSHNINWIHYLYATPSTVRL